MFFVKPFFRLFLLRILRRDAQFSDFPQSANLFAIQFFGDPISLLPQRPAHPSIYFFFSHHGAIFKQLFPLRAGRFIVFISFILSFFSGVAEWSKATDCKSV